MFNDLIKKGKDVIFKAKEGLEEKRKVYNIQKEKWDKLLLTNHHINLSEEINVKNENASEGRIKKVMDLSPSANKNKAETLAKLFSIYELLLDVCYVKEATTNKEYFFVITSDGVYITDFKFCNKYEFSNIKIAEIIIPGMLSSNVNINNVPFVIEGSKEDNSKLVNILIDSNFRNAQIDEKKKYLKGIKLTEEYLNKYYRGVSIGENNLIVFHDENDNILLNTDDILSVDVLFDNSVVYTKGLKSSTAMTSAGYSCYKMSIRLNLKNDGKYIVEILPPSTLNKVYNSSDEEYISSYAFCKQIVNKIYSLMMGDN